MARSRRSPKRSKPYEPLDIERLQRGVPRTEVRRGIQWHVQPVAASRALKPYKCPGCGREVAVGTEHVVVWRADSILGDDDAIGERRHWHTACWRVG